MIATLLIQNNTFSAAILNRMHVRYMRRVLSLMTDSSGRLNCSKSRFIIPQSLKCPFTAKASHSFKIVGGLLPSFDTNTVITQANSSILASAGKTVILCTLARRTVGKKVDSTSCTVDFRTRHHGVGKIPLHNQSRRDNTGRASDTEILSSRSIDRSIRPLLRDVPMFLQRAEDISIICSLQAYDHRTSNQTLTTSKTKFSVSGDPVALAINAASATLVQSALLPPSPNSIVAAVKLCLMQDGTVLFDPSPIQCQESRLELLYAGTKDHVVMIEFCAKSKRVDSENIDVDLDPGVPENISTNLIRIAHDSIQPIISTIMDLSINHGHRHTCNQLTKVPDVDNNNDAAIQLIRSIYNHVKQTLLKDTSLFSLPLLLVHDRSRKKDNILPYIHDSDKENKLLSKVDRAEQERDFHCKVRDCVRSFLETHKTTESLPTAMYDEFLNKDESLVELISSKLLSHFVAISAINHGYRLDGRKSTHAIRPVSVKAPFLPDIVHGSSLFSRGETQVLCTATLGIPSDGQPLNDPFASLPFSSTTGQRNNQRMPSSLDDTVDNSDDLVGSLRYLKSQAALQSDINSKRIKAEREKTGESGTFEDVRRAFLHYDFPTYSTGEVGGIRHSDRRSIGHGYLTERAIMPILPSVDEFPYVIRMTSEVTSSNGSSSMASACGTTLALLDAGVPLKAPVAGVSVGLVAFEPDFTEAGGLNFDTPHALMVDITGNEDHYGLMDFKIVGTKNGITAMQLDVKKPLPLPWINDAMILASGAREIILQRMASHASWSKSHHLEPRKMLKSSAPRVEIIRFDPIRKRDLVGHGGAVLRQLEDRFGISLDLSQEGQCLLYSDNADMVTKAKAAIMDLVSDIEEGEVYEGTVIELRDFGAVVELLVGL